MDAQIVAMDSVLAVAKEHAIAVANQVAKIVAMEHVWAVVQGAHMRK